MDSKLVNILEAKKHQHRGDEYKSKGYLVAAICEYSDAVRVSQPNTALHFLRGSALVEIGDYKRALVDINRGLQLDPENPTLKSLRDTSLAGCNKSLIQYFTLSSIRVGLVRLQIFGWAIISFLKRNLWVDERRDQERLKVILSKIFGYQMKEPLPLFCEGDDEEIHETLVDAPLTVEDAVSQSSTLRRINQRVKSGFYAENLAIISCLEKSGSTTLEICVREMFSQTAGVAHNIGIQKTLRWGPFSFVGQLYPEVLLYVSEGGVLRSVLQPLLFNCSLLNMWGCSYLILFRHPADRLVGRFCDPTPQPLIGRDQQRWRRDPQYLISDIFDCDMDMEDIFEDLINNGYLLDTLNWMGNWLRVRDQSKSMVVRYEDMRQNSFDHFSSIHHFLFQKEMGPVLTETITDYLSRYKKDLQPGDKMGRHYPKGYSGAVGIWRDYFSEKNIHSYNRVVNGFIHLHSCADQLLAAYPDLLLPNK